MNGWRETVATCVQILPGPGVPRVKKIGENLRISCALQWAANILTALLKEIHYLLINSESEQPQGLNARKNNNNEKERSENCIQIPCLETRIHLRGTSGCHVVELTRSKKSQRTLKFNSAVWTLMFINSYVLASSVLVLHKIRHKHLMLFFLIYRDFNALSACVQ
jgi:hypothetical protein